MRAYRRLLRLVQKSRLPLLRRLLRLGQGPGEPRLQQGGGRDVQGVPEGRAVPVYKPRRRRGGAVHPVPRQRRLRAVQGRRRLQVLPAPPRRGDVCRVQLVPEREARPDRRGVHGAGQALVRRRGLLELLHDPRPAQRGCYEKAKAVAQKICAAEDQFQALNITACRRCALEGEVPADGRCIRAALEPKCSPDPAAAGSCADCKRGGVSYDTFLFSGGCYNTSGYVGSQLCTKVNDRAECDAWNTGDYGVFKLPDYHMAYLCSNTSAGGVQGCSRCRYDSTKKKAICYDCEYDMLAFDGMSCITGTDCKGDHRQRRCSGSSERGCRCECADKYYRSGEQCSACASSCLRCNSQEETSCTLCPSGQALAYNGNGTAGTCKAGCTPDSTCEACGLEVDQTKYCSKCKDPAQYPLNGACTPASSARTSVCQRQSDGACQQCSSDYFLMGGGCYQVSKYPGRFVCKQADGGKCVDTTDEYSINSKGELVDCNSNCETCVEGQRTQCLSCAPGRYLKKEGAAPHGACVSRADCSDGYYADHDAMECLPCGIDGCSLCHLIGASVRCSRCRGASLVGLDRRSCTTAAPENAVEFWGMYVCDEGSVLSGDACVRKGSQDAGGALSSRASIGIGVGASLVVLALVGVLAWWLVFQRRRTRGAQ
ncbi:High cysteine membrane protein Group 1 [Giardia lamblia P15]|uniref:High cysteine membrane protein Group 1 n=1 Tax=Giardia intestinalis (strain P15) TaxID=658858 RepID=E1F129_GIAIA|nr:High cysteine membrane protein Group 1 [Giardia lamblia P15]